MCSRDPHVSLATHLPGLYHPQRVFRVHLHPTVYMADPPSFFDELKRRRVVRTGIAYTVVAVAVMEATSIITPALGLADWVLTAVVIAAIAGLPLVLVLEWLFEVTRQGVRRTAETDGTARRVNPWVPTAALAVLVAGAAGLLLLRFGGDGDAPSPDSGPAAQAVAILPCTVRGGEDVAYLREGMVDLLSTKLGGTDAFRPLDPRTVLPYVEREGVDGTGPQSARDVARHFAAGHFILCGVLDFQGNLQVSAALYRTEGELEPVLDVSVEGTPDELFDLVDDLAGEVLTASGGTDVRLARLAALTTDSLAALKRYLDGVQAERDGGFDAAVDALLDAVRIDSTFALAYYHLASAAGWAERGELVGPAIDSAHRWADRLPELDQTRVRAGVAYRSGAHLEAKRLYRQITEIRPEDGEAWYQLGEVFIHEGWLSAEPVAQADRALRRAVELETGHAPVLFHLTNIAAMRGDLAEYDELHAAMPPDAHQLLPSVRAARIYEFGSQAAVDSLADEIAAGAFSESRLGLVPMELVSTLERADQLAMAFTGPGQPVEHRMLGHARAAGARMAGGRVDAAYEALAAAKRMDPAYGLEMEAYVVLAALPAAVEDRLPELADRLSAWDGTGGTDQITPSFAEPHAGLHPWLRLYFLGLVEARLGRTDSARSRAFELAAATPHPDLASWIQDLAATVVAEAALADGDPAAALEALTQAPIWSQYSPDQRLSPVLAAFYQAYLRGVLLDETGRPQEALLWFESLETPFWMPTDALSTRLFASRAQVHAALGEGGEADRWMEKARNHWRRADDPEVLAEMLRAR